MVYLTVMRILFHLFYLVLLSGTVFSGQYPPATVAMNLIQVSDHVYYAQGEAGIATDNEGFISNAAAIITDQGVVVVDTLGSPSLAELFLEKLSKLTDKPIVKVIVTHYHADHIYGLQVYRDMGVEILGPAGYQDYLDSPQALERLEERRFSLSPWVNEQTRLVSPDRVIDDVTEFSLGGVRILLTYLGVAHSDGDLSVLVEPDRVLISGDIIFEGRIPFTGGADTAHWLEILEKLDRGGITALVPGHGPAAEKPAEAIQLTLRYLHYVRDEMAMAVREMIPFDEAYAAVDWSEFSRLPAFEATHRRNAFGIYLALEQEMMEE